MPPSGGFTLTELLAVVVISGVLGSLLWSALSGAKGKVLQTVCRSNMHQLGVAFMLYLDSNNDTFPSAGDGTHAHRDWVTFSPSVWEDGAQRPLNIQADSTITPYLGRLTTNVLRCPADRVLKKIDTNPEFRRGLLLKFNLQSAVCYPFSYSLNGSPIVSGLDGKHYAFSNRPGDYPVNRGMASYEEGEISLPYYSPLIRHPVQKIMLAEEQTWDEFSLNTGRRYGNNVWSWDTSNPTGYVHDPLTSRHDKRGQVVLADGHVETVRPSFADDPSHADPAR